MAVRRRARGIGGPAELFPGFLDVTEIGTGSLATVYRAREMDTGRAVALKLLNVRDVSPRALESFQRESIALGALSAHPNIVTLYRTFQTADGRPVLVLELCAGSIFDEFRQPGGLTTKRVVSVGVKMAAALETAHRAQILHRDVKPQNILITEFGEPALADFGVAMLQATSQTTSGLFDFTTLHVAPELLEGRATSPATDVYELASSLYQLLAGQSAFRAYEGESPASVILRILRDPVRPLVTDGVPVALSDLLVASMAKEQQSRPPTAAEFAAALARVEQAEGWVPTTFLVRDASLRLAPGSAPMAVPAPTPPIGLPAAGAPADAIAIPVQLEPRAAQPVGQRAGADAPPIQALPAVGAAPSPPRSTGAPPTQPPSLPPAPAPETVIVALEPPPAADFTAGLTRICDHGHLVSGAAAYCPSCGSTTLIEAADPSLLAAPAASAAPAAPAAPAPSEAASIPIADRDRTHVVGTLPVPQPPVNIPAEHDPWNPAPADTVGAIDQAEVATRPTALQPPTAVGDTAVTAVHPGRPSFAAPPRRQPELADPSHQAAAPPAAANPPTSGPPAAGPPDRELAALPIEWGAVRSNAAMAATTAPSPVSEVATRAAAMGPLRQVNFRAAVAPEVRWRAVLAALAVVSVVSAVVVGAILAGLAAVVAVGAGLVAAALAGFGAYRWAVPAVTADSSSLRTRGQPAGLRVEWTGVSGIEPRYLDPQHADIVVHTESGPTRLAASAGTPNEVYQLAVRLEGLRRLGA